MSRFIHLKCIDDMEIIVNFDKIVRINYTKGLSGEVYKLCLTDGREHFLNLECGKNYGMNYNSKPIKNIYKIYPITHKRFYAH